MDADFLNVLTVAGPSTEVGAWWQDDWIACADAGFGPGRRILATRDEASRECVGKPDENVFRFAVETTVYNFPDLVDWEGWATRHPSLRFTLLIEQLDGDDIVMLYEDGSLEPSLLLEPEDVEWPDSEGADVSDVPDVARPGQVRPAMLSEASARRLITAGAEYGRVAAKHIACAPHALEAPDVVNWLLSAPHQATCAWAKASAIAGDGEDGRPRWIAYAVQRYEALERWRQARIGVLLGADRAVPTLVHWLASSGSPYLADQWAAPTLVLIYAARHVWTHGEIPLAERVRIIAWLTGGVSSRVGPYPASLLVPLLGALDPATRQEVLVMLLRHSERAVRIATARLAPALAAAGAAAFPFESFATSASDDRC